MTNNQRKKVKSLLSLRLGFTLTEIAFVMGIIGFLLAAVWTAASHVSDSKKVQQATAQVIQIVTGYRSFYAQHLPDTTGTNNAIGIKAGVFPSQFFKGAQPVSPFGNPIYVVTYAGKNEILITYGLAGPGGTDALTTSQCMQMAMALTTQPDVIYENINATTNPNPFTDNSVYTPFPFDAPYGTPSIKSLCSAHTDTGNQLQIAYKAH